MGRRRARAAAIALAALCAPAAACGDDHAPPTSPPTTTTTTTTTTDPADADGDAGAGAAVGITLEQYRAQEVAHLLSVQATNRTDAPIRVATLALDWPGLRPIDAGAVDYPLPPGGTVDLEIDYGEAVCDDPPAFVEPVPTDPAAVVAVLDDGTTQRWPVDDVRGVLARIHGLDCRRQAVEARVDVALGRTWTPRNGGAEVRGTLTLTRRGGQGPVALTGISGSVLLNVDVDGALPVVLDGDRLAGDRLDVPIVVSSTGNCTAHALADSKKTYDVQVTLQLEGAEVSISVTPDLGDQPAVYRPVEVTCGFT